MSSGLAAALAQAVGQYHRASIHRGEHMSRLEDVCSDDSAAISPLCSLVKSEGVISRNQLVPFVEPVIRLMKTFTVYEVMGNSTQVVVVGDDAALHVAFIAGQESRVNACTLWDPAAQRFSGVLTVSDYVRVLAYCHDHPEDAERIAAMTIREWQQFAVNHRNNTTQHPISLPGQLVYASAEEPLIDAIQRMLDKRVNRLPVFADEPVPGSVPCNLVSLLTFTPILTHLCRAVFSDATVVQATGLQPALSPATLAVLGSSPPVAAGGDSSSTGIPPMSLFSLPVGRLGFNTTTQRPVTVTMGDRVIDALKVFLSTAQHAIPIVDNQDIIIDIISRSDVIRLESGGTYDVNKTLGESLSFRVGGKVAVFSPEDSLREVTLHFVENGLHDMFCVNDSDAVVGYLSLTEIVKFFFSVMQSDEAST